MAALSSNGITITVEKFSATVKVTDSTGHRQIFAPNAVGKAGPDIIKEISQRLAELDIRVENSPAAPTMRGELLFYAGGFIGAVRCTP